MFSGLKSHFSYNCLHTDMVSVYESTAAELGWELDQGLVDAMRVRIEEEVKKLDEK